MRQCCLACVPGRSGGRPGESGNNSGAPANGQTQTTAATGSDQEIIVTARRRSERLLNVPVAVTAYSGEQLEPGRRARHHRRRPDHPERDARGFPRDQQTLTPFIRGIGQQDPVAGFEQGVGLYIDDVYLNRPQAAVLDIYDVQRIEVLRGPQGTLYGRNTIGGAIKYVTRRIPTDGPHASLPHATSARTDRLDVVASASAPLTSSLQDRRLRRPAPQHRLRQEPDDRRGQL